MALRSGFTFGSMEILMMPLSVVAVHSRNRQQPVLGFEFNVGIVERALKGAGRGTKEC